MLTLLSKNNNNNNKKNNKNNNNNNINKKLQKIVLNKCDNSLIDALCDIALNILNGNIKIKKNDFNKLKQQKKKIRFLVNTQKTRKKKQKFLTNQIGSGTNFIHLLLKSFFTSNFGQKLMKHE